MYSSERGTDVIVLSLELYLEKWSLTLDGNKLTCIDRNVLYDSLYGKRTLLYWHKKDNVSRNPEDIMWEESRLARRRTTVGLRRVDSKLLCNQCGLAKTLYNRRHQDTHRCPVCEAAGEDRDHLLTCPDSAATEVFNKVIKDLDKIMKEKDTEPNLQKCISDALRSI